MRYPEEKAMMPTSQTGIFNTISESEKTASYNYQSTIYTFRIAGFTLIELIVVLFILSLALSLIMPSFWDAGENSLRTQTRHMSSTLRYIHDEAVSKKRIYSVNFDFDKKSWGFRNEKEAKYFSMKDDVELKDIVIPSRGEISTGELIVKFSPLGLEEPLTLHLKKGDREYTIFFNHLNGRTKILDGYKLTTL
jgi:general secretion pathway protein H